MKSANNQTPPGLALKLLSWLIPDHFKDDIAGDLIEEFNKSDRSSAANQLWFWQQTMGTCWRYTMTWQTLVSLGLAVMSLTMFLVMTTAVTFLAYGEGQVYSNDYWVTGAVHLFFAEPVFWESLSNGLLLEATLGIFVNIPSLIWTGISLALLMLIERKQPLSLKKYITLVMALISIPYLWGMLYFMLNEVALKQAGPIIAFMWLPVLFLIVPLSYGVIRKINNQKRLLAV